MSTHPNRRTVVKAAAWTTPALLAVSATPAFAATPGTAMLMSSSWVRTPNEKKVAWKLVVTNTGTTPLASLMMVLKEDQVGLITGIVTQPPGWTSADNGTWLLPGTLAPGETMSFDITFNVKNNGHTVLASLYSGTQLLAEVIGGA